jgi:hypothetical protein
METKPSLKGNNRFPVQEFAALTEPEVSFSVSKRPTPTDFRPEPDGSSPFPRKISKTFFFNIMLPFTHKCYKWCDPLIEIMHKTERGKIWEM